jgi:Rab-GTPase-TBC domain
MPNITYCQGMNCVAGTLLHVIQNEEDSFYTFKAIIDNWDLEKIFEPGLPDLLMREFQFNHYAKKLIPDLYNHFRKEGITTGFFMSRWYLTIFSICLPINVVEIIWDCVFYSRWKAIIKISLALMIELKEKLLGMDKAAISSFLRDGFRENNCDYRRVLVLAYGIKVTRKELDGIRQQFYIQVARYKLNNSDPFFDDQEIKALEDARLKLSEKNNEKIQEIKDIQSNIENYGKIIGNCQREYFEISSQMHELENLIESLCEKKAFYIRNFEELQQKYYIDLNDSTQSENQNILKEDLLLVQDKIKNTDDQLKKTTKEYISKVI